jgi:hypothetical protein
MSGKKLKNKAGIDIIIESLYNSFSSKYGAYNAGCRMIRSQ